MCTFFFRKLDFSHLSTISSNSLPELRHRMKLFSLGNVGVLLLLEDELLHLEIELIDPPPLHCMDPGFCKIHAYFCNSWLTLYIPQRTSDLAIFPSPSKEIISFSSFLIAMLFSWTSHRFDPPPLQKSSISGDRLEIIPQSHEAGLLTHFLNYQNHRPSVIIVLLANPCVSHIGISNSSLKVLNVCHGLKSLFK